MGMEHLNAFASEVSPLSYLAMVVYFTFYSAELAFLWFFFTRADNEDY